MSDHSTSGAGVITIVPAPDLPHHTVQDRHGHTVHPCAVCGYAHLHPSGDRSCAAHRSKKRLADGGMVPCRLRPLAGLDKCRVHGPNAGSRKKAARNIAKAKIAGHLLSLGVAVKVDPSEAMLAMVAESYGNVAFYRARIQDLDQLVEPTVPVMPPLLRDFEKDDEDDEAAVMAANAVELRRLPSAIAGRVDPDNWKAERHVLVAMYDDERERLMRWCKMCRDAGIDEARLELAKAQGQQLAAVIAGTLAAVLGALIRLRDLFDGEIGSRVERAVRDVWATEVPQIVRAEIGKVRQQGADG